MNKRLLATLLGLAALMAGCAPPAVVFLSAQYQGAKVKRVALVDFGDYPGVAGSGDISAGIFEKYLLLSGYTFVDRNQVLAVMSQQNLQVSGSSDPDTLKRLGQALNVDALAFGQVNDFTDTQSQTVMTSVPIEQSSPVYGKMVTVQGHGESRTKTIQDVAVGYDTVESEQPVQETETDPARVALSVRLVDAQSGEVLWSASASSDGNHLSDAAELASAKLMQGVAAQIKKLPTP
jgi:hypothetical protein